MFITVYHEIYFIKWIFRAVPSFFAPFPDYKFLCNFYLNTTMAFLLTLLPTVKRKRDMGLQDQYVFCVPEVQISTH
jgi:hypothetical protein